MNNEQAKQEAIKAAYVPKHATEDEFKEMLPFIDTETGWFNCINYSKATGKSSKWYKEFLPYELSRLRDNNGWIRIEPDGSNLPPYNGGGKYKVWTNKGNEVILNGANAVRNHFHTSDVTHYKLILDEPAPIY